MVGSLGDIKVFLDEPVQAERIRAELVGTLNSLCEEGCHELYLVAHSTGAAIAYETLALSENADWPTDEIVLITCGSILNMVWEQQPRASFKLPLQPDNIRWVNLYTRYDPASPQAVDSGPNARHSKPNCDDQVTNEDDVFRDHSAYWQNDEQVISRLVEEIWSEQPASHFLLNDIDKARAVWRRKIRILALSLPRLMVWYSFPVLLGLFLRFPGWVQNVFQFAQLPDFVEGIEADKASKVVGEEGPSWWENVVLNLVVPDQLWERILLSILAAAVVTFLSYLVYRFYREVVWELVGGLITTLGDRLFDPQPRRPDAQSA